MTAAASAPRVLVVDDDPLVRESLALLLRRNGYAAMSAPDGQAAIDLMRSAQPHLLLADLQMPGMDGLGLLSAARQDFPSVSVFMITAYGTVDRAVQAMRIGASDFISKPIDDDDLLRRLDRFFEERGLVEPAASSEPDETFLGMGDLIGTAPAMQEVYRLVEAIGPTSATVLIQGENGTGKSLLARAIHDRSPRRDAPFVEISCGALPETLLESELFGHVRGAFTGAVRDRAGKFETANGGTLFLDDIACASPSLQLRLLRILQDRRFEMVGSNRTITADVRVIAASNVDLADARRNGTFREDLFYRISVFPIVIPPLRERADDVRLLSHHFVKHFSEQYGKLLVGVRPDALSLLEHYRWPGNVREIENAMERAVIVSNDDWIGVEDLPPSVTGAVARGSPGETALPLDEQMKRFERQVILNTLQTHGGNRTKTAEALGINRTTLFKKMRLYGLFETREEP